MNAIQKNKKIAIIHDSFTEFGGAERVLFYLIKMFPEADVYTSLISNNFRKQIKQKTKGRLTFSKLSSLLWMVKNPSLFKPYFYHYYWESLNLDQYDLVISSSHSFCANFVKVKNKHLSYIYTPPRFLHDEFNEMSWLKKPLIKIIANPYFGYLRKKIAKKLRKIDIILSDSINVQKRLEKYYQITSTVVYPPVKLAEKNIKNNKLITKNYLFFSRLVKQKGIDLVIETFNKNGKPLLVVGTSNQKTKWQKIAKKNIKFLGFVEDLKMSKVYQKCRALIYASINEDFGMVPVEAMSYGLPIIAYQDGGVKESVIDQKTGLFFRQYNEKALNKTISEFEKMKFSKDDCIKQAQKFGENKFATQLSAHLNSSSINHI